MKQTIITTDVVTSYSMCPRKAYLLLYSKQKDTPHEYVQILAKQKHDNQTHYLSKLKQKTLDVHPFEIVGFTNKNHYLTNVILNINNFETNCGLLTKVATHSSLGRYSYEPTIFIGTRKISKEDKLALYFTAFVLAQVQGKAPISGSIVDVAGKLHKTKLVEDTRSLLPVLEPLQEWLIEDVPEEPPVILNKHCLLCQFRNSCRTRAKQENNLSLLARVTPRIIRQYGKKGIFTVTQLSHTFKPRKRKKRAKNPSPIVHKLELQALAIREQKTYFQELPAIEQKPVELFLDIEGIPDQDAYYLFGLLVSEGKESTHYSFWANTLDDEKSIWEQFIKKTDEYPDVPIYHYGSYEVRALKQLVKRYDTESETLFQRLVNVNGLIYGKVYFPVYSNSLKDIGELIGAKWSSPNGSGLQSLVWRYYWDQTQNIKFRNLLLTYNQEDCHALRLLLEHLCEMIERYKESDDIVDIDRYKEKTTPVQTEVSSQFTQIFKLARFEYDKNKISFSQNQKSADDDQIRKQRQNARKAQHEKYLERKRRAKRKIQVPDDEFCPKCDYRPLKKTSVISRRYIIDLILTQNGIRKAITEYFGFQGYCTKCQRNQIPLGIKKYGINQAYDHGFGAWIVYQRVELRLSYDNIVRSLKEQFNESIRPSLCIDMIRRFGVDYTETKDLILEQLLQSPFIHADETRANIRGVNWYIWVFTDGKNSIYQLHQSREAEIAQVFFADYTGIVISDFYAGYDSVKCEQQKCWVHLIRDLNNDLRENPFDIEFEGLVISIRNLIVPIMEAVIQFGLKKRHLKKFGRQVDKFYKESIESKVFKSDIAQKYQKRFVSVQCPYMAL